MKNTKPFITIKPDNIQKVVTNFQKKIPLVHNILENKMNAIVKVVFTTATAKRPMINAKGSFSKGTFESSPKKKGMDRRVSDPNAIVGVPVDTGALKGSIESSVMWKGDTIVGEIDAGKNIPYANAIEYGTSRMQARPFMRPAYNENLEWIKSKWKEKSK